jgi:CDP-6-deoxy-D-xylo-4-hexulose-3-dehydrase
MSDDPAGRDEGIDELELRAGEQEASAADGDPAPAPTSPTEADRLRAEILDLVRRYSEVAFREPGFVAGESTLRYAGRVFDDDEVVRLVDSSLDFWLTEGRFARQFQRSFARWFGLRHALLVNSGSSANLLALSALTSPKLGDRALQRGDEVITVACGFPTTVNPTIQNGLVPVFCDVDVPTYNIDVTQLEEARSERTRAVMIAHTLGNPFDLGAVTAFAEKHDLWLVEDCCDAVGSTYGGRQVGTFGDIATVSFYPAHHMTMGEGGCVLTNTGRLKVLLESMRDWGRDCWCDPGKENTCGKRFGWQVGELPAGYDHKYIYSHVGYNLKVTDMQAAVGLAQLEKLDGFVEARRRNFALLHEGLAPLAEHLILPQATPGSDPSWFGFPMAVRIEAPFGCKELVAFVEDRRIATRELFGGNLTRQPAYQDVEHRKVGDLRNSDFVMNNVFWVGVYPGLTEPMIAYMVDSITEGVRTLAAGRGRA